MNAFTPQGRVPTETAKEMCLEDIRVTIEDHVHAAKCAIEAGFDAVEIVRLYSLALFFHLKISIDKSGC
jgi:N-ethylmaleimide reductase